MGITKCDASTIDPHVYQTWNNTFYSPGANFSNAPCSSLKEWQAGEEWGVESGEWGVVTDWRAPKEKHAMR